VTLYDDLGAVDGRQCGSRQDLRGSASGSDAAAIQHHDSVAELRSQIEIVYGRDNREAIASQRVDERHHLQLIFQVQVGGGFIE